jgi:hypothetical protein
MMKIKIIYILFIGLLLIVSRTIGQTWDAPEDQKGKTSPFKFSTETVKNGEIIFLKNCTSCHGTVGKNNFVKLTPPPGDPATDKFQKQTDGELFYKITTGKSPMPEFRNILSEEQRWLVISYFRSFNPTYIQPEPEKKGKGFSGENIDLSVKFEEKTRKIQIFVTGTFEKQKIPVQKAEVKVFVKRYFGNLQIDETKHTNEQGAAAFTFPTDLPGDTAGNVNLLIKIRDESGSFQEVETIKRMAIGTPTHPKSLIDDRAWWSVRLQAPIWLILIFNGTVLIVYGFIAYIVYQLFMVYKIGKKRKQTDIQ